MQRINGMLKLNATFLFIRTKAPFIKIITVQPTFTVYSFSRSFSSDTHREKRQNEGKH